MLCLADRSRTYRAESALVRMEKALYQRQPTVCVGHRESELLAGTKGYREYVCQAHELGESESDEGTDEGSEIQAGEVRLPDLGHGSLVKFKDLGVVNDAPNTDIRDKEFETRFSYINAKCRPGEQTRKAKQEHSKSISRCKRSSDDEAHGYSLLEDANILSLSSLPKPPPTLLTSVLSVIVQATPSIDLAQRTCSAVHIAHSRLLVANARDVETAVLVTASRSKQLEMGKDQMIQRRGQPISSSPSTPSRLVPSLIPLLQAASSSSSLGPISLDQRRGVYWTRAHQAGWRQRCPQVGVNGALRLVSVWPTPFLENSTTTVLAAGASPTLQRGTATMFKWPSKSPPKVSVSRPALEESYQSKVRRE
ncbi:hypothetical protein BKA70DRAFT_1231444 [Coprinopsis sp. MPI-PUGE-AT-0042]|nr:hypothetical protein BKA70DRAFT_1231444 [Coprinopsis sp. MPI-PUGE-AT-0042]